MDQSVTSEKQTADEALARQVAHILGSSSAAAKALFELDRRRSGGEAVEVVQHGAVWLVRPSPSAIGSALYAGGAE